MSVSESWRAPAAVCASLVALLAAACGGGGGAGGASAGSSPPTAAPAPPPAPAPTPAPAVVSNLRWLPSNALHVERDVFDPGFQVVMTASLAFDAPHLGYWYSCNADPAFATVTHVFRVADDGMDFRVAIATPPDRAPGTYTDTLSVRLCEDQACAREIAGRPFRLRCGADQRRRPCR
jgi:hypothetical protein